MVNDSEERLRSLYRDYFFSVGEAKHNLNYQKSHKTFYKQDYFVKLYGLVALRHALRHVFEYSKEDITELERKIKHEQKENP